MTTGAETGDLQLGNRAASARGWWGLGGPSPERLEGTQPLGEICWGKVCVGGQSPEDAPRLAREAHTWLCGVGLNLGLRLLLEAADKNLGQRPHSSQVKGPG